MGQNPDHIIIFEPEGVELRQTLRYLGVPIKSKAFIFRDNKSVVTSSTIPHSVLNKRHNMCLTIKFMKQLQQKYLHFIGVTHLKTKVIS